jgi:hypothetical protein
MRSWPKITALAMIIRSANHSLGIRSIELKHANAKAGIKLNIKNNVIIQGEDENNDSWPLGMRKRPA